MPPKAKLQAPIDRPLSRAYLREFAGWSTAYPPGLSDPTSLRIMENVMVNRDGSARVRPGLRYLSYLSVPEEDGDPAGVAIDQPPVGSHEAFFLNDGSKAYLFAVREDDGTVGFRVLATTPLGQVVIGLTHPLVDFDIPQTEAELNFPVGTTYVKYLQIDNKIFALSDNGEPMRMFFVGADKLAKKLNAILRPEWNVTDKLSVVHPDAGWLTAGPPSSVRTNILTNPSFETNTAGWTAIQGSLTRNSSVARSGAASADLASLPAYTNLMPRPLHNVASTGIVGWSGTDRVAVSASGSYLRSNHVIIDAGPGDTWGSTYSPRSYGVVPGKTYTVSADYANFSNVTGVRVRVRWYNSAGVAIGDDSYSGTWTSLATTRHNFSLGVAPAGAASVWVIFQSRQGGATPIRFDIRNVRISVAGETTSALDGDDGANFFWTGAVNNSSSVYHPPADAEIRTGELPIDGGGQYWFSGYVRAATTARNVTVKMFFKKAGAFLNDSVVASVPAADTNAGWTRFSIQGTAPAGSTRVIAVVYVDDLPRGEVHRADDLILEKSSAGAAPAYFSGDGANTLTVKYAWTGAAHASSSTESTYAISPSIPPAETPTANTLVSNSAATNTFNFGFFYTFGNEVGESAASQVTLVKAQRAWSAWRWETANGAGEPSGVGTTDPILCADQLVAFMPQAVYDAAVAQGATTWNLYMFTWSNQANVPSTAVRVGTKDLVASSSYQADGWLRVTPVAVDATDDFAVLPTLANRYNYSDPSRGGQGLVASDRLIMVKDPTAAAVVKWSANQQGDYSNFTAARGGGYKTLTYGNLYIPACVKLWQNPQSVDTLTILCMGVDGQSTSFYMAPAEVSAQSETTQIMGFEETTATPGTTSPYGVEIFNNALYHPLDDQLMKSTANNYNISHKNQTEQIRDRWEQLIRKQWIVSSQYDGRLYFIVNNPAGEPLEEGCNGNEIWVFDATAETGTWSRWMIQAHSLRKVEQRGRIFMSVVRPDGIYYLDPDYDLDDVPAGLGGNVGTRTIPWKLETNTQGANRAHDAWARLRQANIIVGNFTGTMRYGIYGWDMNGKPIRVEKVYRSPHGEEAILGETFDHEDMLLINRDLKEWFFFAQSEPDEAAVPKRSFGQINLVQYRYAPISVNLGYEYGSVESFEYGHAGAPLEDRTNINGIPIPALDARRP